MWFCIKGVSSFAAQMQQLRKKLSRKAEQQRTRGQLGSLEGLFPRQPVIDEETVDSMEEACTLLQTLLLLRIDDNALLPSIRSAEPKFTSWRNPCHAKEPIVQDIRKIAP